MTPTGYWTIDVDLSPEDYAQDQPVLEKIMAAIPPKTYIKEMEVVIHGRIWRFRPVSSERMLGDFGSWAPPIVDARAKSTRTHDL